MNLPRASLAATIAAAALAVTGVAATPALAHPAPAATHAAHGFGFNYRAAQAARAAHRNTSQGQALPLRKVGATSVPSSYSLENYALTPGDQGQVGSCVTWATGYSGYGILMNEQGISGAPMAPMYIYSQIVAKYDNGQDNGTEASIALPMEQQQGIDTQSDYYQGTTDYQDQPTAAEKANAANYKLSGFSDLTTSGDLQTNIESAIASGLPVAIGFEVRSSFENLNSSNYNYNPSRSESALGGHEVTIVGYDSTGVTIENSGGTSWGDDGFFTAPWSFVLGSDVNEVHSIGKLVQS
ncbi:MAG: C1 family peptidase [Actinobacteria bacterium]|nr:C1 family peptidase [Actinomycetota bacterium]